MRTSEAYPPEAPADCPLCPRLVAYRAANAAIYPQWFNGAASSFGDPHARLLVVGLAPGRTGANRTGRPFTGDFAGVLLYETLSRYGFANGKFDARIDDGLELIDCRITNAVRCVPPENKPLPVEINTCRDFLKPTIAEMKNLRVIVALGHISHNSVVSTFGAKKSQTVFKHSGKNMLGHETIGEIALFSSYHCSRYNTNTGVLTTEMFRDVFEKVRGFLDDA